MKTNVFIQARMSSSRLPGKVLENIVGKPMLLHIVERLKYASMANKIVVLTSEERSDDPIKELCENHSIDCFRGSLNNVLERFYLAGKQFPAEQIVRITADCPLVDSQLVDSIVSKHITKNADFTSNCHPAMYPDGLDVEVIKFKALEQAYINASTSHQKEHVTPYLFTHQSQFECINYDAPKPIPLYRLTVDHPEDLSLIRKIYASLYANDNNFSLDNTLNLLAQNPAWLENNAHFARNETLEETSPREQKSMTRYQQSEHYLQRAQQYIPLGAQTFSKSQMAFPKGASPLFLKKGKGCQVTDVDENQYIDFVNGLLAISLGYCDTDIDNAVMTQMQSGVSFSLSHPVEIDVAKKICELIPCAEQVRFAKNGSDATSAAIRLARAYTKKEHIAVCGYHGWQDWYIGSTSRKLGVPESTQALTHTFQYNNLSSLEALLKAGNIAAVIMEPMNVAYPDAGFLQGVKQLCEQYAAILIFDETITGFRFHLGGGQSLFNVTPDLATFGKGIANGFPISVICGKAEIMELMNDIFFSGTFAGETLSLAATLATIKKIEEQNVISHISSMGNRLIEELNSLIKKYDVESWISTSGHPSWSFIHISEQGNYSALELRSLFIQEMAKRGILINSSHNLSFAHKDSHIDALLLAYDEVLPMIISCVANKSLDVDFFGTPLQSVFKVR